MIVSRFNQDITDRLLSGALAALKDCGVSPRAVKVVKVPGAFELPGAAQKLARSAKLDAVVCLGAVIRGETEHFTYVAKAAQEGLMRVALDTGLPITFGVLTTEDSEQALARSLPDKTNKGYETAVDAVELANTYRSLG